MIRMGALCRNCTSKKCNPDYQFAEIECPSCNGQGCDECAMGLIRLSECPNKECSDMFQVVQLADLFEKGVMPIAGGALDQSAWFVDAVNILKADESRVREMLLNG
jgi:hypothetical protein